MALVCKWLIFQGWIINTHSHFCIWRIGYCKNTQTFFYEKTLFQNFKSLNIHSSALEGLIQILQERWCSLSHNSIKCVPLHIKTNAMALLSNINKYMKFCLSYDNFKNLKMVWIHSTMVKLFWSFKKVEAFQLEPVKNES